ncbi:phosphonatase-like hydrolase [Subtercola sp. PAMC28395]|uniref:phosphonatase-like hydrolase n=1 Tax=Subtercola sp. PAMC28395 TaxID=2846775 RepID=UPI001C0E4715|nr:phosphonatase-like hydrolase [Subtercola sp. PAMC28395]QWT24427.1 phosphonatase-like hydrolase [Subtercola sp. PAMC28395]
MIELVVCDMAGTTIDDHGLVYDALADAVIETGATLTDSDVQQWMGTDKVAALTALIGLGGVPADDDLVSHAFARFRTLLHASYVDRPPVALPGVEAALRELASRGIAIALSTGFSDDVALPLLASLGWTVGHSDDDLLDAVITTSDVAAGRPAPYLIHHAMEKTGTLSTRAVLAAGDTAVDLFAAENAGVIGVGVLTGGLSRAELMQYPHRYILDSVADIPRLPETLPSGQPV